MEVPVQWHSTVSKALQPPTSKVQPLLPVWIHAILHAHVDIVAESYIPVGLEISGRSLEIGHQFMVHIMR